MNKETLDKIDSINDVQLLLYYIKAELSQAKEFEKKGRWHVDCNCFDCRAIQKWMELSWWRRLKAKLTL